ncbi:MAG: FMN-binding glutamate synthase family protein, partial [Xanthomonadales bacterium]|nr:FMN-binding glutamate synthase family protein [Xanthomonadales bacterium]
MLGLPPFVLKTLEFMATLFVFAVGTALIIIAFLYFYDKYQTSNSVRRNYPVVGRFRTFFEHLGEFFRQYFFAMDREELPFNRAQRNWANRASEDKNNTGAFGSTKNLAVEGTVMFANCMFPQLDEETMQPSTIVFGPHAKQPYETSSFFNISAMSYGSISKPAVQALSHGAQMAGIWLNTGEGGIAPWHLEGGCDVVFQIGTAKYGVRDANGGLSEQKLREVGANPQIRMIELKLSQGAKPGKGGILPAAKIDDEVAAIRGVPKGKDAISPNRHREVNDFDDLLDLIAHIREVTGKPVGFKTCLGSADPWFGFFKKVKERGPES